MEAILFKGVVFSGTGRGEQLIQKFNPRLVNVLKLKPFNGTLNIKLDAPIDFTLFSEKRLDNILMDGTTNVDAEFAKAKLIHKDKKEECWVMKDSRKVYGNDVLEIISEKKLRDVMDIKDDDEIEIEMYKIREKKRITPGYDVLKKVFKVK